MTFALIALVVVIVALVVVIATTRRPAPTVTETSVTLTAADITAVVASQLNEAVASLNEESRRARAESLELTAERVSQLSGDALSKRTESINQTLESYKTNFDTTVGKLLTELSDLREMNAQKFGNVDHAVDNLAKQTQTLNNVLSSSQGRGNWGERMLEDILAQSGFKRGLNYERQETLDGGGRPDYTFKLPPNRVLFLDSKFPLDNYIAYFEASDDTARRGYRDAFIKNVEARVKELEDRDYQSKEASALDYVLLFIPNESVLAFIQQEKPSLIDEAVRRRVVLCSPLTLYAFLSVVRQATDSFYMEQRANEVFGLLSAFGRAWADYDRYLKRAATRVDNLQETIKSLTTGRIRSTLQKQLDRIDEFATSRGIDASGEIVAELHAAIAESNIEEIDE